MVFRSYAAMEIDQLPDDCLCWYLDKGKNNTKQVDQILHILASLAENSYNKIRKDRNKKTILLCSPIRIMRSRQVFILIFIFYNFFRCIQAKFLHLLMKNISNPCL